MRLGLTAETANPYSIANAPGQETLEFLIRQDGSALAVTSARRLTRVHLEGPHGRFSLAEDFFEAHAALFVAGGTGIAPLRAMLIEALRHQKRPHCTLIYSARNSDEFAFAREFRRMAREGSIALALAATRHAHSRWKGLSGRLGRAIFESVVRQKQDPQCYVCGPEGFVGDIRTALEQLGVTRIRTEEQ